MGLITKVIVVLLILFVVSGFLIVKNKDLDLRDGGDAVTFAKSYVVWTGSFVKNIASVTGHVVKLDWLPKS